MLAATLFACVLDPLAVPFSTAPTLDMRHFFQTCGGELRQALLDGRLRAATLALDLQGALNRAGPGQRRALRLGPCAPCAPCL